MPQLESRDYPPSHVIQEDGIRIVEPFSFPVRDFIDDKGFRAIAMEAADDKGQDALELPQNQLGITFIEPGFPKFF